MDRDLLATGFLGRTALPIDKETLLPKGEAMQAPTVKNGSQEHRISEALQEVEVKMRHWPWMVVAEVGFGLIALVALLWLAFSK